MLSNAYFLVKFRFDTAENEPTKNLQNLLIFPILLTLTAKPLTLASPAHAAGVGGGREVRGGRDARRRGGPGRHRAAYRGLHRHRPPGPVG